MTEPMPTWVSWYDLTGDAAEKAGVAALLWVDERSPHRTSEIDTLLVRADVRRLPTPVVIDLLNATLPLKDALFCRAPFAASVHVVLGQRLGPERADRLMRNRW